MTINQVKNRLQQLKGKRELLIDLDMTDTVAWAEVMDEVRELREEERQYLNRLLSK